MAERRHKNAQWLLQEKSADNTVGWDTIKVAVLMDIRDELQAMRRLMECYRIPMALDTISRIDKRLAKRLPLRPKK